LLFISVNQILPSCPTVIFPGTVPRLGRGNSLIAPLSSLVGVEVGVDPVGCVGTAVDDAPQPLKMPTRVRSDTSRSEERESDRRIERFVAMRETPFLADRHSFT